MTPFGLKVTRSDKKNNNKKLKKNREKSKKRKIREKRKKKTDIPFHFYIVYFGAGCDFFNTVFINPDLYISTTLSR